MSAFDSIHGINSSNEGETSRSIDMYGDLQAESMPSDVQADSSFSQTSAVSSATPDQMMSGVDAPVPLPFLNFENNLSPQNSSSNRDITSASGILAGMGALLAPQECEPGDLPSIRGARSVIQRTSDSGEVAFEPLLSPPEVNLVDVWLKSGQSDWMNLDQLPSGHPRRFAKVRGPRNAQSLRSFGAQAKKKPAEDVKMTSLLSLLSQTLKNKPKRYVTGLRGELLEEGDEQLLGNTDVMVLPYSPPPLFRVDEETKAEKEKREKEEREHSKFERWKERKRKRNIGRANGDESDANEEGDEQLVTNYLNFDVFDFFEKLLSKNAPGTNDGQDKSSI